MFTRLFRLTSALLLAASPLRAADSWLAAPAADQRPYNQLLVSGNACGPAALLTAFRTGDPAWRNVETRLQGANDKQRLSYTIRAWGLRPSQQLAGRTRWSKAGINVNDLVALANDMTAPLMRPRLASDVLSPGHFETPDRQLARLHARMKTSLAKGLPPLLSIRRTVLRRAPGGSRSWMNLEGHFVTITGLPAKLPKGSLSFPVTYADPWGGRSCRGEIRVPAADMPQTFPEAIFPATTVGKARVKAGEATHLEASAVIGRW